MAPSPTGFFHIGNAKTTLYNWLFARNQGGAFVLRLEDTDLERSKEEYADIIGEALAWLGLDWDEGPGFGGAADQGDHGPYRQSQRTDLYQREARRLLEEGKAYRCFATKEELEAERDAARQEKRAARRSPWRDAAPADVEAMGNAPYVVRFKVPDGVTQIDDLLQGVVRVDNREVEDFAILRADATPVFHLAVVADDGLMKITHVIRGDDHLTNAAKHVMLFQALGYEVPRFVHHPLIHDEEGQKYSKRKHGANVLEWREDGYLPEALVNYLALLGWSPGDDREVLTPEELVREFSIERMTRSAARFDLKKIQWLNGQHIRRLPVEELRDRVRPILEKAGLDLASKSPEWLTEMAAICQEKIATLNDIVAFTDFFFADPAEYEEKGVKKQWTKPDSQERMAVILDALEHASEWTAEGLHETYQALCEQRGHGLGKLVHPTRLALTGKSVGPGLFELAALLGRETCLARMNKAIEYVKGLQEPPS